MKTSALLARLAIGPAILLYCWQLSVSPTFAATVVSGNVSGTWTTTQSPYILTADCTVVSNQTLTIQPGVTVIIGPDVRLTVAGSIAAIGTPERQITFRGATPTSFWYSILLTSPDFTNVFRYCRMSEARYGALFFGVVGGNRTMAAEVENCSFSNCVNEAIDGAAQGLGLDTGGGPPGSPTLQPIIRNCIFDSTANGCTFRAYFTGAPSSLNPTLTGNVFKNLTGEAVSITNASGGPNTFHPVFLNNTVANVRVGLALAIPDADATVENNIFFGTSIAVLRVGDGSPSPNLSYNCFYGNTLNFAGYPGIYGLVVTANHNNDPCDAFSNIFLGPRFIDASNYLLSQSSPCIDAGDPAIFDACFAFSKGTTISDIGAFGGPDACNWPTVAFAPVITGALAGQSSCVGGNATFKVRVDGSEPLTYRWYLNGVNLLAGETNAQLNLVNLQTNQAGLYSATVSNAFGSVTSAPAALVVSDACVGVHAYAGLSITGIVGRTYAVEAATNLGATNWTLLATNTFTQPQWLFIDTNTPVNPARFLRVRLQP